MERTFNQKSFYFLRHGETDHNVHGVYDDVNKVFLNTKGRSQALKIKETLASLPISTVCCSPLDRAQQTKLVALEKRKYHDVSLNELQECPSELWRLFLAWELRSLTVDEWALIGQFVSCVERGLCKALQYNTPTLLISHGGVYWALAHLLNLEGDRKIDNCHLVEIFPDIKQNWIVRSIMRV